MDVDRLYLSFIGNLLVSSADCHNVCSDTCFSVLSRARSVSHLRVLEATYIRMLHMLVCVSKKRM